MGAMSSETLQIAMFGWSIVQALLTAAVWLYTWATTRERARQGDLEELRKAHEKRLTQVETSTSVITERLKHLPTAEQIAQLTSTLAEVKTQVGNIEARTARIEDFLTHERRAVL